MTEDKVSKIRRSTNDEGPAQIIIVHCDRCKHKRTEKYLRNNELRYRAKCTKINVILSSELVRFNDSPDTPAYCPFISDAVRSAMIEIGEKQEQERKK